MKVKKGPEASPDETEKAAEDRKSEDDYKAELGKILDGVKEKIPLDEEEAEVEAEKDAKDDGDGESAGGEPERAAEAEGDEAETGEGASPLLDRVNAKAKDLGMGPFKTEEEYFTAVKSLRTKLSQRDDLAALGRELHEAGYSHAEVQELLKSKTAPRDKGKADPDDWNPPHEWDPAWDRLVTVAEGEDGKLVYDGPADAVRKYRENEAYARTQWQRAMRNPRLLYRWIAPDLDRHVDSKIGYTQSRAEAEKFIGENQEFIDAHRVEIQGLMDEGASPEIAIRFLKTQEERDALKKASETGTRAAEEDVEEMEGKSARPRRGSGGNGLTPMDELAKLPTHEALRKMHREGRLGTIPAEW